MNFTDALKSAIDGGEELRLLFLCSTQLIAVIAATQAAIDRNADFTFAGQADLGEALLALDRKAKEITVRTWGEER